MAKQSLLEKALTAKRPDKRLERITPEEIELALAWLQDEVTLTQVAYALGMKGPGNAVSRMAVIIREAYRAGLIKVKDQWQK